MFFANTFSISSDNFYVARLMDSDGVLCSVLFIAGICVGKSLTTV